MIIIGEPKFCAAVVNDRATLSVIRATLEQEMEL
jgi:hypothetical protein